MTCPFLHLVQWLVLGTIHGNSKDRKKEEKGRKRVNEKRSQGSSRKSVAEKLREAEKREWDNDKESYQMVIEC